MQTYSVVYIQNGTTRREEDRFPSAVDAGVYCDMLNRTLGLPPSAQTFYSVVPKYPA